MTGTREGSPYAPHTDAETRAMLETVGADDVDELFDIPEAVQFDRAFGIEARDDAGTAREIAGTLAENDDLTSFLGRGHYAHHVPAVVDRLSSRSEFLTSYTQYQPEIAQGFLQALFEYQSMLVELTGLPVANASMYDHATALGEAATLAARVRSTSGSRVLVPELLPLRRRSVLENYAEGADLTVESYPTDDGNADLDALTSMVDSDTLMVYAENPTVRGTIEERLSAVGDLAADSEALFCLGTDPVALSLLETPASVGADVVVGDAGTLGLGHAHGMGHGLFVTREQFLRQVPGRLVGAGTDERGRRAYTLTLQTREQHIRRERATSNICTNQAWVALRTAIHLAWLGPDGLLELAERAVRDVRTLASRVDDIDGVRAPVHDRHHFREFLAATDRPAPEIRDALLDRGYAVHAVDDHRLQLCVTDANEHATDGLVAALSEVA
ncbi:Glycine cleavage system protein P (pyridoxal-binding), N-terminal domain [Halapricum desulfuricans]|uniref:Glycine cleavage system protein P (Pyridoxal-binding), N-terminal domain n=1 Tax=Halapricum desulfuricans TaxID=2841257 RepID=A0A897NGL6_9EURY|nr:aminomethyl-transferring glycine dehydrogenase subunit GcvPA [Halapricum desulfuricans]QSG11584.1 Glycine cleavage system protein P (pyridoxal-binding), N-terminal domain [Halapricum desulfuricans]